MKTTAVAELPTTTTKILTPISKTKLSTSRLQQAFCLCKTDKTQGRKNDKTQGILTKTQGIFTKNSGYFDQNRGFPFRFVIFLPKSGVNLKKTQGQIYQNSAFGIFRNLPKFRRIAQKKSLV